MPCIGITPTSKDSTSSSPLFTLVGISSLSTQYRTCDHRCVSSMPSGLLHPMGTRSIHAIMTCSINELGTMPMQTRCGYVKYPPFFMPPPCSPVDNSPVTLTTGRTLASIS